MSLEDDELHIKMLHAEMTEHRSKALMRKNRIDELEAENENLLAANLNIKDWHDNLKCDYDKLKEENSDLIHDVGELVKAANAEGCGHSESIEEVARLREALEEIKTTPFNSVISHPQHIAEAALKDG